MLSGIRGTSRLLNSCTMYIYCTYVRGIFGGIFKKYFFRHCVISRNPDFIVSVDAGIESRTVATAVIHLIHIRLDLVHVDEILPRGG